MGNRFVLIGILIAFFASLVLTSVWAILEMTGNKQEQTTDAMSLADFDPTDDRVVEIETIDQEVGTGDRVVAVDDVVTVNYTGALMVNGQIFDSGEFTTGLGPQAGVIEGWKQGLLGMKKGGKRRILIPANLAYGDQGSGEAIPPDSDLVFDIELVGFSLAYFDPTDDRVVEIETIDQEVGTGDRVVAVDDVVTVNYTGALMVNGQIFDSGEFTTGLGPQAGVIEGWKQGLLGMKEGGKRRLLIPASLAYGAEGEGEAIPPDSDLVFDVELVGFSD